MKTYKSPIPKLSSNQSPKKKKTLVKMFFFKKIVSFRNENLRKSSSGVNVKFQPESYKIKKKTLVKMFFFLKNCKFSK